MSNQIGQFEQIGRSFETAGATERSTGRAVIKNGEVKPANRSWFRRMIDWVKGPTSLERGENVTVAKALQSALKEKYGETIANGLAGLHLQDQLLKGKPLSARQINQVLKDAAMVPQQLKGAVISNFTHPDFIQSKVEELRKVYPSIAGKLELNEKQMKEFCKDLEYGLKSEVNASGSVEDMQKAATEVLGSYLKSTADLKQHLADYYSKGEALEQALQTSDTSYSETFDLPAITGSEKKILGMNVSEMILGKFPPPSEQWCKAQLDHAVKDFHINKAINKLVDAHLEKAPDLLSKNGIRDIPENEDLLKDNMIKAIKSGDIDPQSLKSLDLGLVVKNMLPNVAFNK